MNILLLLLFSLAWSETTTFFSFSRRVQTCDPQDLPLQEATSKIAWSYNSQDPIDDNNIFKHDERGVKSVRFFNPDGSIPDLPPDAQALDIKLNNIEINFNNPNQGPTTQYWCSAYKISGTFSEKRQMIRVEPIIDPRNYKNVHHIIIYQCPALNDTDLAYQGGCYQGSNTPYNLRQCNGGLFVTGWAVGGYPQNFPEYIGYPFEGQDIYLMMETHYDNPNQLHITDSSGMRVWHTGELREYDAGTFTIGYMVDEIFTIPGGQQAYTYNAYCPEECTRANFPPEGFNMTAVSMHTHLAGRSAYLRHFRNGTELPPIMSEPYYDFNFQELTFLQQERHILPGDSFQVQCIYNTMDRINGTHMGLSTQEEMCYAFILYYPKFNDSEKEHCMFGNYTNIGYGTGPSAFCGETQVLNWSGPPPFVPYTPPVCNYQAPPSNNTIPILVDRLDTSIYTNNITLDDEDGKYKLYWAIDRENLLFHAAVEVQTEGWVGLGVSPAGMEGADVFIGWVKDGQVHFADRFATAKALPPVDTLQDFYNIQAGQYETTTTEPMLSQKAIIGISVGAGLVFIAALILMLHCLFKKRNSELDTALTTSDTYGGTRDTRARDSDEDYVDPPSTNQRTKEPVAL